MLSDIQVGNHFHWEDPSNGQSGSAVIKTVRSSNEAHMGPEISEYTELWIEALGESGDLKDSLFTILLGTDEHAYLDGRPLTIDPIR